MASKFLYHITPTENLESILVTGLMPNAGRWHGPRRMERNRKNITRALELMGRIIRSGPMSDNEDGTYNIEIDTNSNAVKQGLADLAKLGAPWPGPKMPKAVVDEWPPLIFLTTSLMAAYEVACEFSQDKHHDEKPLTLLTISRSLVSSSLVNDTHIHLTDADRRLMRSHRKTKASLMTEGPIPVEAISEHSPITIANLLKSAEFRRWMGINKKRK